MSAFSREGRESGACPRPSPPLWEPAPQAAAPPCRGPRSGAQGGAGGGRSLLHRPRLRSAWARRGAAGGRGSAMALGSAWKQMSWLYYQYLLVTALYMLEPWERTVFSILLPAGPGGAGGGCAGPGLPPSLSRRVRWRLRGCSEAAGRVWRLRQPCAVLGERPGRGRAAGGAGWGWRRVGPGGERSRAGGSRPEAPSAARGAAVSAWDRGLSPPRWRGLSSSPFQTNILPGLE